MIRVIRVLFWHQWRNEVQVVVDGIASAAPILVAAWCRHGLEVDVKSLKTINFTIFLRYFNGLPLIFDGFRGISSHKGRSLWHSA